MFSQNFKNDIIILLNKLKQREHFSFSKYADGEYAILRNIKITNTDNWTFDPTIHPTEHKFLMDSFTYDAQGYYIGISCPCCQPKESIQWMRDNVKTKNITFANIFVNSNYNFFKKHFIPEFNSWEGEVTLVANGEGKNKKLPFKINYYYDIKIGSWINPDLNECIETLSKKAENKNNQLFLFSSGPLGNILAHKLHYINKNNTYLDIGSTINPWIVGNNRKYLSGKNNKICKW
jgi:hypothetical protein